MKNKGAILIQLFIWVSFIGLNTYAVVGSKEPLTVERIFLTMIYSPITYMSVFYINYTLLIPELIKKQKKYLLYILSLIVVLVVMVGIKALIATTYPTYLLNTYKAPFAPIVMYMISNAFSIGFLLVFSLLLRLTVDWFANERIQRSLETEKKEMELQFLKSQLNPHFLFNSLNNIYSLAYQKSDKTADAVLKLSEIMRYMIYESNDSKCDLGKEVDYLKNYIELHRIRFKDGGAINLNITGEIDGQQIVPLILISFVENAFKHGVANDPTDPIKINLIANQKILHFSVTNKKNKDTFKDKVGGVGLSNVERRLQLMYPDRYKLNIVNSATHYTTELMLDL